LQERGVGAESQDHGVEEQKLEWDVERSEESLVEGLRCAGYLGGGVVLVVVCTSAKGRRFFAEEDGVECFWYEEDAYEDNSSPDEENIEGPAPKSG